MELKDRLKQRRIELGLTLEEVGNMVGVGKSTVRKWETGYIENMRRDKIALLAKALQVSPTFIMQDDADYNIPSLPHPDLMPIKTKKWRVIGDIACGEPIYANEDFDSYIEAGADIPADFCVKAKGDSMINARILDGDIVFIKKQPMVNNGDIAAVIVGDEITLKRFYKHSDTVQLLAENPKYEPLVYTKEDLNQIYIIGKAVAFQSDL